MNIIKSKGITTYYEIVIENKWDSEKLFIDGQLQDEKNRKNILSWLTPYKTLSGEIRDQNGSRAVIKVIVGGVFSLNCKVKVNDEVILKDKVRLNLF